MKKDFLFFIAALLFVACGGGSKKADSNSITLPVEAQVGEFGNYATFPKELTIKLKEEKNDNSEKEGIDAFVTVDVNVTRSVASDFNFPLTLDIVDSDYNEIVKLSGFLKSKIDDPFEDYANKLVQGPQHPKFQKTLTLQEWEDIKTKGAYFILKTDEMANYKVEGGNGSYQSKMSSTSDSSDESWDELLDSYESYVDKYISAMKKVKDGDASAMSEYPDLYDKANELSSKIQNVQGELTSNQLSRYTTISNKMLKAAQDMQ